MGLCRRRAYTCAPAANSEPDGSDTSGATAAAPTPAPSPTSVAARKALGITCELRAVVIAGWVCPRISITTRLAHAAQAGVTRRGRQVVETNTARREQPTCRPITRPYPIADFGGTLMNQASSAGLGSPTNSVGELRSRGEHEFLVCVGVSL